MTSRKANNFLAPPFGTSTQFFAISTTDYMCSASAVHVQSVCGLTQQVRTGRETTWQGCETNFLSLGPDVISLTSIRLTTGPISQSYLGPTITSTCGPLVANHPQIAPGRPPMSHPFSGWISVSGLTYPLSLWRTHPGLGPAVEKSLSCPMWDSNPRPPDFVPAALTTRLRQPVQRDKIISPNHMFSVSRNAVKQTIHLLHSHGSHANVQNNLTPLI